MSETARWTSGSGSGVIAGDGASWIDAEVAGCALGDKRLCSRLRQLLQQLEGAMGAPLPVACQDVQPPLSGPCEMLVQHGNGRLI